MFSNSIETIKSAFSNYYGNGRYFVIFCIAIFLLFIEEKDKENRNLLVYYPLLMLVLILNPIFCYIILKIVDVSYYRFFWTLPTGIVIAYSGTQLISKLDKKYLKIMACIFFIFIIGYSGVLVYSNITFEKVNNWYKLPDECVQIVQIIEEIPLEEKKLMISTDMIGYIRQLDASIKLAYLRKVMPEYYNSIEIVNYYNAGDVEKLCDLCKEQNVNMIAYDNSIPLTISPSHYGYNLYAQTEHYDIYALIENE